MFNISCKLWFPLIAILEQLLLVVKQFLMRIGGKLIIGALLTNLIYLYNCVYWTCLLAEAAIDALGHVYVVVGGASGVVRSGLGLDVDAAGGTGGRAQFASDAPFLPGRVSTQSVFTPEVRTQRAFFVRVVYGPLRLK